MLKIVLFILLSEGASDLEYFFSEGVAFQIYKDSKVYPWCRLAPERQCLPILCFDRLFSVGSVHKKKLLLGEEVAAIANLSLTGGDRRLAGKNCCNLSWRRS